MSDTVADLRDLMAQRAAVRQYRKAARRHTDAGNELMLAGEFGWAGVELRYADIAANAALAEKLTEATK